MTGKVIVTKQLATAVATAIAASQIPVSGTALTVNGSLATNGVATLDTQRRVLLTFGSEAAPRALAITGTNQFGNKITETISATAGGAGTIATNQDFLTVSALIPSGGGWTSNVTVGTNTVGSTPWVFADRYSTPVNLGFGCVIATGAATYSVEYTYDNANSIVNTSGILSGLVPTPFVLSGISSASGNTVGSIIAPIEAWRLTINSGTGAVVATGMQAGITQ